MTPKDLMKKMIYKGDIETPIDDDGLISLMGRYATASRVDYCLQDRIDLYKDMIIKAHAYKSMSSDGCYISLIKQALRSLSHATLDDVVTAVYGVDLMTKAIQELIVEDRISVRGKKIYLIKQETAK